MKTIKIDGARMLLKSAYFPRKFNNYTPHKYTAIIGLGGNIGNTSMIFDRFLNLILKDRRFAIVQSSPMLVNKAFGYVYQIRIKAKALKAKNRKLYYFLKWFLMLGIFLLIFVRPYVF